MPRSAEWSTSSLITRTWGFGSGQLACDSCADAASVPRPSIPGWEDGHEARYWTVTRSRPCSGEPRPWPTYDTDARREGRLGGVVGETMASLLVVGEVAGDFPGREVPDLAPS